MVERWFHRPEARGSSPFLRAVFGHFPSLRFVRCLDPFATERMVIGVAGHHLRVVMLVYWDTAQTFVSSIREISRENSQVGRFPPTRLADSNCFPRGYYCCRRSRPAGASPVTGRTCESAATPTRSHSLTNFLNEIPSASGEAQPTLGWGRPKTSPNSRLQIVTTTSREVIRLANNQEEAVKRAARDAGKGSKTEQQAYDAYRQAGGTKDITAIRGK